MRKSNKLPLKKTKKINAFRSNPTMMAMPTDTTSVTTSTVTSTHIFAH